MTHGHSTLPESGFRVVGEQAKHNERTQLLQPLKSIAAAKTSNGTLKLCVENKSLIHNFKMSLCMENGEIQAINIKVYGVTRNFVHSLNAP